MTQQEIQEKIINFLVNTLEFEEKGLTPDAHMQDELGMTSLDATEMALFIRRTFGFQPQRGDIKTLTTLQSLYDYIEAHMQK